MNLSCVITRDYYVVGAGDVLTTRDCGACDVLTTRDCGACDCGMY
jgi:hypothetical protein